jgi:hypothetical protein
MKCIVCFLLLFSSLFTKAQETYSISGTVNDEKGHPIPGATVFLTNTKSAVAANDSGKFILNALTPGNYELVIKMLGFNPYIQNVAANSKSVKITARLTQSVTALNTVTINALPDPRRGVYLSWFIGNFIGTTSNSAQCKLLNPDVLRFNFDNKTGILQATSEDFIIMENMALGYKLKYLLTDFKYDFRNGTCAYTGYPYFEELKGTVEQEKKWEINRKVAYLGSDRHFFRALAKDQLNEEGFLVYLVTNDTAIKKSGNLLHEQYNELVAAGNIQDLAHELHKSLVAVRLSNVGSGFIIRDKSNLKTIISPGKATKKDTATIALTGLYIVYTRADEPVLFYRSGNAIHPFIKIYKKEDQHRQISMIRPVADPITIDRNGMLMPAKSFLYAGYWSWERMADMVPLDYFVDPLSGNTTEENK